jgi:hypothetical protein
MVAVATGTAEAATAEAERVMEEVAMAEVGKATAGGVMVAVATATAEAATAEAERVMEEEAMAEAGKATEVVARAAEPMGEAVDALASLLARRVGKMVVEEKARAAMVVEGKARAAMVEAKVEAVKVATRGPATVLAMATDTARVRRIRDHLRHR